MPGPGPIDIHPLAPVPSRSSQALVVSRPATACDCRMRTCRMCPGDPALVSGVGLLWTTHLVQWKNHSSSLPGVKRSGIIVAWGGWIISKTVENSSKLWRIKDSTVYPTSMGTQLPRPFPLRPCNTPQRRAARELSTASVKLVKKLKSWLVGHHQC